MAYRYEIPAKGGRPLVDIPTELKQKTTKWVVGDTKIVIEATDLIDEMLYESNVVVRDLTTGEVVSPITEYGHPSVATAVIIIPYWDTDHVYAWKPARNWRGYKRIDKGEVGVDDARVIQAAVDYVAGKGGGEVRIREGEYSIGAEITLKPLVNLIGAGREVTKLKLAYNGDMFTAPSDARLNSQRIAHMTLDGDKANRSAGSAFNVYAYRTFFEDLVIKNFPENGLVLKGVNLQGDNTIRDCFILGNENTGVKLDSQVSDCTLYNVWIGNNGVGLEAHAIFKANLIHVYGGQVAGSIGVKLYNSALIENSYIEKFGKQAIIIDSSERWTGNINIVGCWIRSASMDENNTYDSILLDATGGNSIRQVKIIGCIFSATETNKPRYHICESGDVDKTVISLCSFANHQTGAYSTVGANDIVVNNMT